MPKVREIRARSTQTHGLNELLTFKKLLTLQHKQLANCANGPAQDGAEYRIKRFLVP